MVTTEDVGDVGGNERVADVDVVVGGAVIGGSLEHDASSSNPAATIPATAPRLARPAYAVNRLFCLTMSPSRSRRPMLSGSGSQYANYPAARNPNH